MKELRYVFLKASFHPYKLKINRATEFFSPTFLPSPTTTAPHSHPSTRSRGRDERRPSSVISSLSVLESRSDRFAGSSALGAQTAETSFCALAARNVRYLLHGISYSLPDQRSRAVSHHLHTFQCKVRTDLGKKMKREREGKILLILRI